MENQKAIAHCSFCDSEDVNKLSQFGTAQLVSQFYCNNCQSVFEFIRWQDEVHNREK
ncbi:hypothetical protein [Pseudobacillus wudalianchiensis]|uniref:PaaD-like zinc ribbon domain-containing protein n=1 Tax=Pseudobacillus wudalianchiensis TaxID=1743143 RepID=UPI00159F09DD|nr:hypothetical protein [Bacillus wudalianchiensis]